MKSKLGFVLCVCFLVCGSCFGSFVLVKNSLQVTSPDSLKDVYESAIGNFGLPQYGGTLTGAVIYPKPNRKACMDFRYSDVTFKSRPGGLPIFLLADRGDCYFTMKALRAQNAGAAAILIADDRDEPLITWDTPEEDDAPADYLQYITIPSVIISKSLGDDIKKALSNGEIVNINLNWTEASPHPVERVEYEFWTSSNYECGPNGDSQIEFFKSFKGAAQRLEQNGFTQFTPHYITWYCPEAFILSKQCRSQCINHGRYCAPDPEQEGYEGKDVVVQNLWQACFYRVVNESNKPWLWWDYVADFAIRCQMKERKYNKECADEVTKLLGVDVKKIDSCVGELGADVENPILKADQEAQISRGSRGDITMLPTLVINKRQFRGRLDKGAVLMALCSGFNEPALCLTDGLVNFPGIEINEHLDSKSAVVSIGSAKPLVVQQAGYVDRKRVVTRIKNRYRLLAVRRWMGF